MKQRKRRDWRWATAGLLIGALVLGLGISLRLTGLGGMANIAQIVSLAPLFIGLTGWARSRSTLDNSPSDVPIRLSELLRTIADAQGLTEEEISARLPRWGNETVAAYMDGGEKPGWSFIIAYLDVIAGDDRWRRELLKRHIRPVWKMTMNTSPTYSAVKVGSVEQGFAVVRETSDWITALRAVATIRRVTNDIQVSINRHEAIRSGLLNIRGRLARAIASLAAEAEYFPNAITERQEMSLDVRWDDVTRIGSQLRDTQQKLDHAERLQGATAERLEESERQCTLAERLKSKAMTQADHARRHLAELEHCQMPTVRPAKTVPHMANEIAIFLGNDDTDSREVEEVLNRVDILLRDELGALNRLGETIASTPPSPNRAMLRLSTILVLLAIAVGGAYATRDDGSHEVQVPVVDGMRISQAEAAIKTAGLSYTLHQQSSAMISGTVISTEPRNGAPIDSRALVTLNVSSGQPDIIVPNVSGMNVSQAVLKLMRQHLRVRQLQAWNSVQPTHTVVRQSPNPGTRVPSGTQVTISISVGQSRIPNVINDSANLAKRRLINSGFNRIVITYVVDPNLTNGTVVSQRPLSGLSVPYHNKVFLSVVMNQSTPAPAPPSTSPTPTPTPTPTCEGFFFGRRCHG